MPDYIIRDYKNGDFAQIMDLWEKTDVGSKKRGDSEKIIEDSIKMGGKFLVLEIQGKIQGSSWMTFDGRRIHLHHLAVSEKYQNQSYGSLISEKSIEFAKNKGYQIKLEVHQSKLKAIHIYKKFGFKYLGDYDVYIIRNY